MTEEEAVIFKQYDFRTNAQSKATFHQAFPDPYHDAWDECPPRRSIECRILLTYPPEQPLNATLSDSLTADMRRQSTGGGNE